jgi:hypothetical protein
MVSRPNAQNNGVRTKLLSIKFGQVFDKFEYVVGIGPLYLSDMLKLPAGRIGIALAETSPNL